MARSLRALTCLAMVLLTACATTQAPDPTRGASSPVEGSPIDMIPTAPDSSVAPQAPPQVDRPLPDTPRTDPLPSTIVDIPEADLGAAVEPVEPEPVLDRPNPFASLSFWAETDLTPALAAFRRSCKRLLKRPASRPMSPHRPELGTHGDWSTVCRAADRADHARPFFESLFVPVTLGEETGLLTGYYETELDVRARPDETFSEPILAKPTSDAVRTLPRSELNAESADVIAYGKPIDVFFLQVQGSGRLHFDDGRTIRAGYAANNGKSYVSIGRVLIERGEMTLEDSSKAQIEAWMAASGPEATRDLMNENPRYIFFSERDIPSGEGPIGAMQVPLTAMGSIAVDPSQKPYGIPVWLETRLPRSPRDHQGYATGVLAITQDTGSAIKGPQRGDLFFGAGQDAGALAGIMKHPARWTVLMPRTLFQAQAAQPVS